MNGDYERIFEEAPNSPQAPKAQPLFDAGELGNRTQRVDLDTFYRDTLLPVLSALETERLAIGKKRKEVFLTGFTIIAASAAAGLWFNLLPLTAVLVLVSMVLMYALAPSAKTNLRPRYKAGVILPVVQHALGREAQYVPVNGIGIQEFIQTGLWRPAPSAYVSEDFASHRTDKTPFYFSEIRSEYEYFTGLGKHRHRKTAPLFNGVLFRADFNKHFTGRIVVKQASTDGDLLPPGNRVDLLEDPAFNERFIVLSDNDPVSVRYVLTPAFMQRLLELDAQMGQNTEFCLVGSSIYVAYYTDEDHFEINDATLLDPVQVQAMIGRLQRFAGIVETLELNTRIWTKV